MAVLMTPSRVPWLAPSSPPKKVPNTIRTALCRRGWWAAGPSPHRRLDALKAVVAFGHSSPFYIYSGEAFAFCHAESFVRAPPAERFRRQMVDLL